MANGRGILPGHTQFVRSVAFHPQDPARLVSGSRDRTLKLWNLFSQTEIQTLSGHQNAVNAVLYAPDGKTIASGSADKCDRILSGHPWSILSLVFTPDGLDPTQRQLGSHR